MCANYYRRTMYVFCVRIHAQAAQACGPRRPLSTAFAAGRDLGGENAAMTRALTSVPKCPRETTTTVLCVYIKHNIYNTCTHACMSATGLHLRRTCGQYGVINGVAQKVGQQHGTKGSSEFPNSEFDYTRWLHSAG